MSIATATVTAKVGPALSAVATVLTGVTNVQFQVDRNVLSITHSTGTGRSRITDYDYASILTVTWTISGANGIATVTIST